MKVWLRLLRFHKHSDSILVINANAKTVDILDASGLTSTQLASPLSASNLSRRAQLDVAANVDADQNLQNFTSGGINSVAVVEDLMAVAVEHDNKQSDWCRLRFNRLNEQGVATYLKSVVAGALPDNVQISGDATYAVVANEG